MWTGNRANIFFMLGEPEMKHSDDKQNKNQKNLNHTVHGLDTRE